MEPAARTEQNTTYRIANGFRTHFRLFMFSLSKAIAAPPGGCVTSIHARPPAADSVDCFRGNALGYRYRLPASVDRPAGAGPDCALRAPHSCPAGSAGAVSACCLSEKIARSNLAVVDWNRLDRVGLSNGAIYRRN